MKPFIRTMKALSDPNRIRIVKLLEQRELCVCELQALLDLAQSTVSKHLRVLEDAGLVEFRKDGLWILYSLADKPESEYATAMLAQLRNWLNDDADIETLLKRLPGIDRTAICRK